MLRRGSKLVVAVSLVAFLAMAGTTGCESAAPDLKEWTVEDHKHRTERRTRREKDRVRNHARPQKSDQLASVTWQAQCAGCHGAKGKGDGPQAVMVKPRDLTTPQWQDSVTDEQIAQSILKGKEKMPAFNLPSSTIQVLVEYVRSMRFQTRDERAKARAARRSRSKRKRPIGRVSGQLPVASPQLPAQVPAQVPAQAPPRSAPPPSRTPAALGQASSRLPAATAK